LALTKSIRDESERVLSDIDQRGR